MGFEGKLATETILEMVRGDGDLVDCTQIPIRSPGGIQQFGLVVGYDVESLRVTAVSENFKNWLKEAVYLPKSPPLIQEFLGHELLQHIESCRRESHRDTSFAIPGGLLATDPHEQVWCSVLRRGRTTFFEFERCWSAKEVHDPQTLVKHFASIEYLHSDSFFPALTEVSQKLCPSERILLYRFDSDWNGEVVAESCQETTKRFLHHWFPESDIPRQVRELYLSHPIRMIGDASASMVKMMTADPVTIESLDLAGFVSRGVSSVHQEYMLNMGLHSSLSVAILREGKLWGLLSIHHSVPRVLSPNVRAQLYGLALLAGSRIGEMEAAEKSAALERRHSLLEQAVHHIARGDYTMEVATQLIDADATVLLKDDEVVATHGIEMNESHHKGILSLLCAQAQLQEGTIAIDCIPPLTTPNSEMIFSGVLLRHWHAEGRHYCFAWLRRSVVEQRPWGGDPRKPNEALPGKGRIQPRKSFETWYQDYRTKAAPWTADDRSLAEIFVSLVQRLHPLPH